MTIQLTAEGMRAIFPRAPQAVLDAFVAKQAVLDKTGVTATRTRLSYFLANIEHECDGFTIPNLTESIRYTPERMAEIWPNRFNNAAAVREKYGTAPGWQTSAFDDIYGNRMGNRPGTHDGSVYIGRGGPQWTGREGYEECEKRAGIPAVAIPAAVSAPAVQPEVCAAYWDWKKLNAKADAGDFKGCVKVWNGGSIGLRDRIERLNGNDPTIMRLQNVERVLPTAKELPGDPPSQEPPPEVIAEATRGERTARAGGIASTATGGAGEATKAGTSVPDKPAPALLSPLVTWTLIGVGVAVVLIATILILKKTNAVKLNWF